MMFLNETDLINARITMGAKLNESSIIRYIIENDLNSEIKRKMSEGQRYYCGKHDIFQKDFRVSRITEEKNNEIFSNSENSERIVNFNNPNRSNHHNINVFHKILVDQKVSYIASREPTITVKGADKDLTLKEYEKALISFADENFNECIQELIIGASNKGFESIHIYYDENGKFCYSIVPAEELIIFLDEKYQKEVEQVIRYYYINVVKDGRKYKRRKVEWWTKEDVTYYVEKDENLFIKDTSFDYNPSPHWWDIELLNNMEKNRVPHSWGCVPFIILKNNPYMTTDLEPIKGLIDAYDLISSDGVNNLLDLVDLYWVIEGYGGETASAIVKKLQINKAVNISDSSGSIEAKQVELPLQGRLNYLNMLRRDIFHFGMGVDVDIEKFGNAPSGVSLKFRYTLLDLKAENMISKLKMVIKKLLWYFTEDLNRRYISNFDSSLVNVTINKSVITNDVEIVNMIKASKNIVSDKTLLSRHPFIDDVNDELQEIANQKL